MTVWKKLISTISNTTPLQAAAFLSGYSYWWLIGQDTFSFLAYVTGPSMFPTFPADTPSLVICEPLSVWRQQLRRGIVFDVFVACVLFDVYVVFDVCVCCA